MALSREWQEMLTALPPPLRLAILERKRKANPDAADVDQVTMADLQALERELGAVAHNKLTEQ